MAEQSYQAVLAVISDEQTLHTWLARYQARGLDGLVDRSHRFHLSCAGVRQGALHQIR